MALVISGFPGIGKSYFYNMNKNRCLDLDLDLDYTNNSNDEKNIFIKKNIEYIKSSLNGQNEYILVSANKDVREALKNNNIPFILIYPNISRKDEFIKRFIDIEYSESYVQYIDNNWEFMLNELKNETNCIKVELSKGNLSDELEYIDQIGYQVYLDII